MGIERFFNKTVIQKRKQSGTGSKVEGWVDVTTTLKCCIYPAKPLDTITFQSVYMKLNITHKMNCFDNGNIKIGDKIVDGGNEYIIKKIDNWDKFLDILLSEVK